MSIKFEPKYTITPKIDKSLMRIEAAKKQIDLLSISPRVIASMREQARLLSTHYSTRIEGNALNLEEVEQVVKHGAQFPGRQRDEKEVLGYYAALVQLEQYAAQGVSIADRIIKTLHGFVMGDGKGKVKPTAYRDEQNVIKNGRMIVYIPPEPHDVPELMQGLIAWIKLNHDIPCPILAGVVHYQFVTVHPYLDGNGRTARLLTTLILHLGGYGLQGLYSLEEYYAKDLFAYYHALTVGPSHNYYMGRAEADITDWIDCFCGGMAHSLEEVAMQMRTA